MGDDDRQVVVPQDDITRTKGNIFFSLVILGFLKILVLYIG